MPSSTRRFLIVALSAMCLFAFPAPAFTAKAPVKAVKAKVVPAKACLIKANISSPKKEKIYHLPGCTSYDATKIDASKGERWFCSEKDAVTAGWRKAKNC